MTDELEQLKKHIQEQEVIITLQSRELKNTERFIRNLLYAVGDLIGSNSISDIREVTIPCK